MFKLLSFWLAWRAIRLIAAAAVVIGAVALLVNVHAGAAGRGEAALAQLRHATNPLEQQLERVIEKASKP